VDYTGDGALCRWLAHRGGSSAAGSPGL